MEAGFGEGQGGPREPIVGLLTALVRYNWVLDDSSGIRHSSWRRWRVDSRVSSDTDATGFGD